MKNRILLVLSTLLILSVGVLQAKAKDRPNVIIILADDLGWGDVGFNGCTDIPTPHLDKLASNGVVFTSGYASHPYCSPSRAGLLTGKYQQRFGHEANDQHQILEAPMGLPLDQTLMSNLLQEDGYKTCAIGKWHLGDSSIFWPINRGFDNWYGFSGGSRNYWGKSTPDKKPHQMYRDGKLIPLNEMSYLTDDFTDAALDYIDTYTKTASPFFMYLAYNAPHAPIQATRAYLDMTEHIEDPTRASLGAMVSGMDAGIGRVIQSLKDKGEYDNTLIVFYSDNGGHGNGTSCAPYRGRKGMLFEGGIRVPFLISWPETLTRPQTIDYPIIALDLFPTIMNAAQVKIKKGSALDGVDLFPFMLGDKAGKIPHNKLFWRYSDGMGYAVRMDDYKLVKEGVKDEILLFNITNDPFEHTNLAKAMPSKVKELQAEYEAWNKGNVASLWHDKHPENVLKTKAERARVLKGVCAGERL